MRKVMLGLVMVMMLMSLVGCGKTQEQINKSEVNSEMKEVINGITGEKETINENQTSNEKTMTIYAKVIEVSSGNSVDNSTNRVKFEFSINDTVLTLSDEYPIDTFAVNNVVKFVVGVRNYGGPDLPDTSKIFSWEIIE